MQRWFERADAERIVHIAGENWLSQSIADALNSRSGYETPPHQCSDSRYEACDRLRRNTPPRLISGKNRVYSPR